MTTRALRNTLALAVLLSATVAVAQREGYSYLSWVGPEVSLVSTAEDDSAARPNTPILAGDRLSTGAASRAEAILADGNVLRVDVQTTLRFDRLAGTYEAEDERNAVFLERGAVSLEHRESTSREEATRIDTDDATILFPGRGLLRVETGRRGTEIYVSSGNAEVFARSGRATLRAGQYAFASGDAELEIDWLDAPRDQLTRFVADRRDLAMDRGGERYVSEDYDYDYAVADFDRHGSWDLVNGSMAWRPSVGADWRPYVDGYWRWSPAGLTWVSYEPWGWLPYHYGSWDWDLAFGWFWTPGIRYSPAWVYWNYTPSWVGWCPIGYYGGYYGRHHGGHYGSYDRSHRNRRGAERWTHAYPHLRGRVDVTRIDPRGWSYASVNRIGSRLDSRRDVRGHESVGFRPGERGLVATTPLRVDRGRGGTVTTAVRDAVRRVPQTLGAGRAGDGLGDLTPILRRDGQLGTTAREDLRRSYVTAGRDPGYRPVSADQIAAPRRVTPAGSAAGAPPRTGERGPGSVSSPARGGEASAPARGTRETWRDGGATGETRAPSGAASAPRRAGDAPLGGGFGRERGVRGDDGWRSPGGETRSGAPPSRTFDVPSRRSAPAPETGESPARTGRREAPAPGRDEGWRGGDAPSRGSRPAEAPAPPRSQPPSRSYDAPRSAPAPRSDARPSRSYEAPSRSYQAPRSAPAPRYESRPSRSYEAPSRSYQAPRSAPAPRYESRPSRSSQPSARSSGSPSSSGSSSSRSSSSRSSSPRSSSSGSGGGSRRSASPRG